MNALRSCGEGMRSGGGIPRAASLPGLRLAGDRAWYLQYRRHLLGPPLLCRWPCGHFLDWSMAQWVREATRQWLGDQSGGDEPRGVLGLWWAFALAHRLCWPTRCSGAAGDRLAAAELAPPPPLGLWSPYLRLLSPKGLSNDGHRASSDEVDTRASVPTARSVLSRCGLWGSRWKCGS